MTDFFRKKDEETQEDYTIRACKEGLEYGLTWDEIADVINNETERTLSERTYRRYYKKACLDKIAEGCEMAINAEESNNEDEDKTLKDSFVAKRMLLEEEKVKVRTEKLEYNRWIREQARDQMIAEKIIAAIHSLEPVKLPEIVYPEYQIENEAILAFGDEHYGTEFKIYGLSGEIINEYSPEIFEDRMGELLNKVIAIIKKEKITKLHVYSLGDFSDGVLRVSQLRKLRYGVIEGTVKYGFYISEWLNELSKYVKVTYQMVYGNHTELRMLGQPKGTFEDENTGLFVREIIRERLGKNPNFEMKENKTGLIFDNVCGFNVLGIHGEVKNMSSAIKDFSMVYGKDIDILIGGHMHHYKAETVGINKDVWNVPSIIGVDSFSMQIKKTSRPGALLTVIDRDLDENVQYTINLT